MTPHIDFISVLYLIGAAQGIFLVIALLDKKLANKKANIYLALFLMIFTLSLIDEFLFRTYYFYDYPHVIGLMWPLEYLYGPLFYFYIQTLTTGVHPFEQKKSYGHFILFFVGIFLALPTWMLDASQKLEMAYGLDATLSKPIIEANIADMLSTLLVALQMIVYFVLSFRYLYQYRQRIRQQFSSLQEIELSWLRRLLWLLILLWFLFIVDLFFSHALGIGDEAVVLLHIIVVVLIYGMGYMGLRQPAIFQQQPVTLINGKYTKSKLSIDESNQIKEKLLHIMKEEKPYLDGEITLSGLAELVGCTSNHLSQVINTLFEKNFFDFVNMYRVERAKEYLLGSKSERMTILAIALEAGFNSKSAFYTAFKKEVGMTPSRFKKSQETDK